MWPASTKWVFTMLLNIFVIHFASIILVAKQDRMVAFIIFIIYSKPYWEPKTYKLVD